MDLFVICGRSNDIRGLKPYGNYHAKCINMFIDCTLSINPTDLDFICIQIIACMIVDER